MMDIKKREDKIKEKRKNTPFRDFVKEICSWLPFSLYRVDGLISRYPDTDRIKGVIKHEKFNELKDELTKNGLDYDPNVRFFNQFQRLFKSINMPNIVHFGQSENCNYSDAVNLSKNSYLGFTVITGCEDVCYSFSVKDYSKNVFNSVMVWDCSENIYRGTGVMKSYNIFYSKYIHNSNNIRFSSNLQGCSECIFCDGLSNQSYYIKNQKLEKEEYMKQKKEILENKEKFIDYYYGLNNHGNDIGSTNTKGAFNLYSEDVDNGYYTYQVKGGRNLIFVGGEKGNENMYDCCTAGSVKAEDHYAMMGAGINASNFYCGSHVAGGANNYYCYKVDNCTNCLGCVGLRNKEFCIFNKEYSREKRFKIANQIFKQMDAEGVLGNFFPASMSPYYFNDTAAYLIDDSFTKEEVTKEGYLRRDDEIKVDIPQGAEVIETKDLESYQGSDSKGTWKIDPKILKKVIRDEKGNYYKIVQMEYDFLMKHGLPLPQLHWLDRIKLGFKFK